MSMHAQKKLKEALDHYIAEHGSPRYLCAVEDFKLYNDLQPTDRVVVGIVLESPDTTRAFYFRNNASTLEFAEQSDIETLAQIEFPPGLQRHFTGEYPNAQDIKGAPFSVFKDLITKRKLWSYLAHRPEVHDITWLF